MALRRKTPSYLNLLGKSRYELPPSSGGQLSRRQLYGGQLSGGIVLESNVTSPHRTHWHGIGLIIWGGCPPIQVKLHKLSAQFHIKNVDNFPMKVLILGEIHLIRMKHIWFVVFCVSDNAMRAEETKLLPGQVRSLSVWCDGGFDQNMPAICSVQCDLLRLLAIRSIRSINA
jgi:hypothetical protein